MKKEYVVCRDNDANANDRIEDLEIAKRHCSNDENCGGVIKECANYYLPCPRQIVEVAAPPCHNAPPPVLYTKSVHNA